MDIDFLMQPLVIGVAIGLVCCCCVVCSMCIYYRCIRKKKTHSTTTTTGSSTASTPPHRKRTGSDLMAMSMMNHHRELVLTWLKHELSLEQYYSLFIENGYGSMRAIKSITSKTQLAEIGIEKKGHQTLIMTNIEQLQRREQNDRNKTKKLSDERKAFNESLVAEWLEHSCNLKQYLPLFIENGFDSMNIIKRIRSAKQLSDIGIHKQGHVLLIFTEIQNLRSRRKTIDQHVDRVYIKINKAQNGRPPPRVPPPVPQGGNYVVNMKQNMNNNQYGMRDEKQKMRNPQYAVNVQQQYNDQNPEIGPGRKQAAQPPVPEPGNIQQESQPDSFPNLPQHDRLDTESGIDGLFGTMPTAGFVQSQLSGSPTYSTGAAVTTEVIDGQFYNVTHPSVLRGEGARVDGYTIK